MIDCALIIVDHKGAVEYRNRHAAALLKSGRAGLSLARGAVTAKAHALREQHEGDSSLEHAFNFYFASNWSGR